MANNILNKYGFNKFYAGVGSRGIKGKKSKRNSYVSTCMALLGYKVVDGHAPGSDLSFEAGARVALKLINDDEMLKEMFGPMTIERMACSYLPWSGFNGHTNQPHLHVIEVNPDSSKFKLAEEGYGKYRRYPLSKSKDSVKSLMNRNVYQVHGDGVNSGLVSFVMACTEDGAHSIATITDKTGGTSMAIAVADMAGRPILNTEHQAHALKIEATVHEVEGLYTTATGGRILRSDFDAIYAGFLKPVREMFYTPGQLHELDGVDVIVHELDETLMFMDSIGEELYNKFPALRERINGMSIEQRKLGGFTRCVVTYPKGPVTIVSAITHTKPNHQAYPWATRLSYDALRDVLRSIKRQDKQRRIAFVEPGAKYAEPCVITVNNLVNSELRGMEFYQLAVVSG